MSIDIQTTFVYSHVIAKTLTVTTEMNVVLEQSCHGNIECDVRKMILTSSLLRTSKKKMSTVYNTGHEYDETFTNENNEHIRGSLMLIADSQ